MANGKYVEYARVSTKGQGDSGLGLAAQQADFARFLNGGDWAMLHLFVEVESGKNSDRPELAKALAMCRSTGATLLIAKLDRLARNVAFVSALMEAGVEFVCVDNPHANKLTIHILAAMAEYEADMCSKRTKAGLAAAKARGTKLGGNRGNLGPVERNKALLRSIQVRQDAAAARAQDVLPAIRSIQRSGVTSLRKLAVALNEDGHKSPRGGEWTAEQVRRILKHAA
jgi:DNA invertase Pin-like site-specific DNA recombinase